jgi:hypothetical protein
MALRHFVWVRYVTKNKCDDPPPQCLSEARRGNGFNIYSLKPPRGRPVGGGGVHRVRGYGGISPHLNNLPDTCITHLK